MIATFVLSEETVKKIVEAHVRERHEFQPHLFKVEVEIEHGENLWRVNVSETAR